eukprot:GHVL01022485.1.p1 GENE.GHVL01022485.1~~GHVL01022485.1.p1  ORF type:complete len:420 (-),score=77.94 GHVL01022485.1:143-1402(-)
MSARKRETPEDDPQGSDDDENRAAKVGRKRGRRRPPDMYEILEEMLLRLQRKDKAAWFHDPVRREDVPDYYDVIKNPICFSQMRDKIKNKEYKKIVDIKADVDLLVKNAKTYNSPHSKIAQCADAVSLMLSARMIGAANKRLQVFQEWEKEQPAAAAAYRLHSASCPGGGAAVISPQDASVSETGAPSVIAKEEVRPVETITYDVAAARVRAKGRRFPPPSFPMQAAPPVVAVAPTSSPPVPNPTIQSQSAFDSRRRGLPGALARWGGYESSIRNTPQAPTVMTATSPTTIQAMQAVERLADEMVRCTRPTPTHTMTIPMKPRQQSWSASVLDFARSVKGYPQQLIDDLEKCQVGDTVPPLCDLSIFALDIQLNTPLGSLLQQASSRIIPTMDAALNKSLDNLERQVWFLGYMKNMITS